MARFLPRGDFRSVRNGKKTMKEEIKHNKHFMVKLVKCSETRGNIYVTSREGLKPTNPL